MSYPNRTFLYRWDRLFHPGTTRTEQRVEEYIGKVAESPQNREGHC
jgi:hypothetical protein